MKLKRTPKYIYNKTKYPEMSDEEYRDFLKKERRMLWNAHSFKKHHKNVDCTFLFEHIQKCDVRTIDELNLRNLFYHYQFLNSQKSN